MLTPAAGVSRLALSSTARLIIVNVPALLATHVYDQLVVPAAGCHVAPLSTETSTPATIPPPASEAVPVTVMVVPACTAVPFAGEVMTEIGGVVSVDFVARLSPVCSVAGCTPMSANRFTVACCMFGSAAKPFPSWFVSSPQDH